MIYSTVYKEEGIYAGWPANHGAWQWGDEFLVGFMRGTYEPVGYGLHQIKHGTFEKVHARSLNGGETWLFERPLRVDGQFIDFSGNGMPTVPYFFDLNNPHTIIRVCGNYDTGGEDCPPLGAYYLSRDRGRYWSGPHAFLGLEAVLGNNGRWCTARTRTIGNQVYLSVAQKDRWGSDWTFVAHQRNGRHFSFDAKSDIVWSDHYRAVMPAVAVVGDRTIVAMRRKGQGKNWIDVAAKDNENPWRLLAQVDETQGIGSTGKHNGNPPALMAFGSRLVCAFANRSDCAMLVTVSDDGGRMWTEPRAIDMGTVTDIGYPQMFKRSDGLGVLVYYWSDGEGQPQYIKSCRFDPFNL